MLSCVIKTLAFWGKYRLTYPQLYVNYPKERHEIFVLKPIKNIMYLRCFSIILAFLTKADECFCERKVLKFELQPIDFQKNIVFNSVMMPHKVVFFYWSIKLYSSICVRNQDKRQNAYT